MPGIRPSWYGKKDDQVRKMTPYQAVCNGADLVVIGRPITTSADPVNAVETINEEIGDNW